MHTKDMTYSSERSETLCKSLEVPKPEEHMTLFVPSGLISTHLASHRIHSDVGTGSIGLLCLSARNRTERIRRQDCDAFTSGLPFLEVVRCLFVEKVWY